MGENSWKSMERKVAKQIGGERVICSGIRGEGDVLHDKYFIECKYRKTFACRGWFIKAKEQAKKQGKTPLLIIKEKGRHEELAIVDWEWLSKLLTKDIRQQKEVTDAE